MQIFNRLVLPNTIACNLQSFSVAKHHTVEPRYNEVPSDWKNMLVITEVRYVGFSSIHSNITGLNNIVRYTGVLVT